jgi:hypothetical protein
VAEKRKWDLGQYLYLNWSITATDGLHFTRRVMTRYEMRSLELRDAMEEIMQADLEWSKVQEAHGVDSRSTVYVHT